MTNTGHWVVGIHMKQTFLSPHSVRVVAHKMCLAEISIRPPSDRNGTD